MSAWDSVVVTVPAVPFDFTAMIIEPPFFIPVDFPEELKWWEVKD